MAVDIARFLSGIESPVARVQQGVQFGQQQADRRTAQEAAQAAAEQKRKVQAELLALSQKENRTADDFQDLIIRNPGLAKTFQASIDQLNTEAKTATITEATNVFAALSSGNTEAALKIVEDRLEAATNSGDQQEVQKAEVLIQAIKSNPEAARTSAGLFLAQATGPERFASTLEALGKGEAARQLDPLNVREKLADIGKTEAETRKILNEVEKNKTAGFVVLSPEETERAGFPSGMIVQRAPDGKLFKVFEPKIEENKVLTEIGKLNKDLAAGNITQEQFTKSLQKKFALSGETAFKAAGIAQASEALPELKKLLFKEGDLRESNIAFAFIPGATENRKTRALARTVVGAMLRGESGAVISQQEIDEALDNFLPKLADSDESALLKFQQLEKRINSARDFLLPQIGPGNKCKCYIALSKITLFK